MKRFLRVCLVAIICNSLIFLPLITVNASEDLVLPGEDLFAPEIKNNLTATKIYPGEPANIHAVVTDNIGVEKVTLFYRNIGATDFKRKNMIRELTTDIYQVSLPEVMAPGIEYYIQANDEEGNTIFHGHTFSPLTITVLSDIDTQETLDSMETPELITNKNTEKGLSKWIWIGLGVLAVGAIAASGRGSDGGSADPATTTVVVTASSPQ